ncbi:MAG: DHHW family protein [Coprococcus sp.]
MHKKIGILIFMALLLIFPVLTFIFMPKEDKPFSENENRYLKEFPEVSLNSIKEETFMNDFDSWFADRFFEREAWISVKNKSERVLGKTETDTVYTINDRMIQVMSEYNDIGTNYNSETIDANINVINEFAQDYPDIPVYFMLCPTSAGIYDNLISDTVKNVSVNQKDMIENCYNKLNNVTGIDITNALTDKKNEYIYYRTDHHWTSYGAYTAYVAAGKSLNYSPYPLDAYTVVTGSDSFQGTLFSKTLDQSVTKDKIDMYSLKDNTLNIKMTASDGVNTTEYESIFFPEYLDTKDKYSTYTGQNCSVVDITTNAGTGKSLLLIKDSYANSMIQFLVGNYDRITMLDMRYINQYYGNLIDIDNYNQVLFLYNCITFADDGNMMKLSILKPSE